MRSVCEVDYMSKIEAAMKYMRDESRQKDWCSQNSISRCILSGNPWCLKELADCLNKLAISYLTEVEKDADHWEPGSGAVAGAMSEGKAIWINSKSKDAANNVLFLDEALPSTDHSALAEFTSFDILRFTRNFGRTARWRVVIAGTAATLANLITVETPSRLFPASRIDGDAIGWAHIIFLYPTTSSTCWGKTWMNRPLLSNMVAKDDLTSCDSEWSYIKKLANKLQRKKPKLNEGDKKLVWLSGAWLGQSNEKLVSPFALKPANLVSSHFFEPCIILQHKSSEPYFGVGIADVVRVLGPLKVTLLKEKPPLKALQWCVVTQPSGRKTTASLTEDFSCIVYSLSHCIQQCLGREPLLATALSVISHMTKGEFQAGMAKCWKETAMQRSAANGDGELFEYATFAALQLACHTDNANGETCSVKEFLWHLVDYLAVNSPLSEVPACDWHDELRSCGFGDISPLASSPTKQTNVILSFLCVVTSKNASGTVTVKKSSCTVEQGNVIDGLLAGKMPWMIPCFEVPTKVDKNIKKEIQNLSELLNVAALVPGGTNAALDAAAYSVVNNRFKNTWVFEIKCRGTNNYSVSDGIADLAKKCQKTPKVHALLVASTGHAKSRCTIFLHEGMYLRIVLCIGNSASAGRISSINFSWDETNKLSTDEQEKKKPTRVSKRKTMQRHDKPDSKRVRK